MQLVVELSLKIKINRLTNERFIKVLMSDLNSDLNFFISNKKTNGVMAKKPMKNLTALNVNGPILSIPVS
jgi:hypothetical protein